MAGIDIGKLAAPPSRPPAPKADLDYTSGNAVGRGRDRLALGLEATRERRAPTLARLARRRFALWLIKLLLPVGAVLLLGSIAAWPEINRIIGHEALTLQGLSAVEVGSGRMIDPRYHGVDARQRPFTVTADTAVQRTPERIDLTNPKGDATLQNNTWLMIESRQGVYMQHAGLLDLSGDVTLYRQDGTTMVSATSSIDLKQGVSTSSAPTHAEGPFGTLDASGYTLVDKGAIVQFQGPAVLVLNQR